MPARLVFLALLLCAGAGEAQSSFCSLSLDSLFADAYLPSVPAAAALGLSSDVVRQVSEARGLCLVLGTLADAHGRLRGMGAIEFAPLPLLAPKYRLSHLTWRAYRERPAVRRAQNLRVSLAAVPGTDSLPAQAACGITWTLWNAGDPAQDDSLIHEMAEAVAHLAEALFALYGDAPPPPDTAAGGQHILAQAGAAELCRYREAVQRARAAHTTRARRAARIALAAALTGASADRTISGLRLATLQLWGAGSVPCGSNPAIAIMLGGEHAARTRRTAALVGARLSSRGTERAVYAEGMLRPAAGSAPRWRVAAGLEWRAASGLWVQAGVAHEFDGRTSRQILVPLELRWGYGARS